MLYSLCIILNMDRDIPYCASPPGKVSPPSPTKKHHFTKNGVAVSQNRIRGERGDYFIDEKL